MLTDTTNSYINSTIVWFEFTACHLFQEIGTSLNFARIFTEVQQSTELRTWQLVAITIRAHQ
ncbi:Uncharacterised protein [Vibrio cholerae]|uniref:Uncharacterized protein n=1 Tax=Vibrio cholerae TaxID=666 RepID=A0A655P8E2_VIBCL|nr:Uncharacterised protein [Vibrio cholerae]